MTPHLYCRFRHIGLPNAIINTVRLSQNIGAILLNSDPGVIPHRISMGK